MRQPPRSDEVVEMDLDAGALAYGLTSLSLVLAVMDGTY